MKLFSLFISLFILCSCQSFNSRKIASSDVRDIIFDLDWTLIRQVDSLEGRDPAKILSYQDEYYRLNDGVEELIESLLDYPNVRISFFSGGGLERNVSVLKQIKVHNRSAFDIAHKILSFDDLTTVSHNPNAGFTERFKKDLRLVNDNLNQVIIVDDDIRFVLDESQKKNFLWTNGAFYHYETFPKVRDISDIFVPKTYREWLVDYHKISLIKDVLTKALETDEFVDSVHKLSQEIDFKATKLDKNHLQLILREYSNRSLNCSDYLYLMPLY